MEIAELIQWLDIKYPDKLPLYNIEGYELGVLVGQRLLVEEIKIKLKYKQEEEEIK